MGAVYIIHAQFSPRDRESVRAMAQALTPAVRPPRGLQHVSVHERAQDAPVIGLFLLEASLAQAEATAAELLAQLCGRPEFALVGPPLLRVALPARLHDRMLE